MKKIERQPNMEYILSISYGKDSLACLGAIEQLEWPLDRIIHAEVWATRDIPADLPPMAKFKKEADKIIKDRYGIAVEHFSVDMTFEEEFYKVRTQSRVKENREKIYGWPMTKGAWCNSDLKIKAIKKAKQATSKNNIQYVGITIDEPERLHRLTKEKISPLAELKWTEADCKKWCIENNLLSPLYSIPGFARGGCWFCYNQKIDQLRYLRKNYPEHWAMMLKWDSDSPVSFRNGVTLHDYNKRFALEDDNLIPTDNTFKWKMVNMTEQELKNIEFNKKVKCIETQKVYANIAEASLQTNIPKDNIRACLRGRQKTTYGTSWTLVNEPQED